MLYRLSMLTIHLLKQIYTLVWREEGNKLQITKCINCNLLYLIHPGSKHFIQRSDFITLSDFDIPPPLVCPTPPDFTLKMLFSSPISILHVWPMFLKIFSKQHNLETVIGVNQMKDNDVTGDVRVSSDHFQITYNAILPISRSVTRVKNG